jgi:uncharacterized protein YkwD
MKGLRIQIAMKIMALSPVHQGQTVRLKVNQRIQPLLIQQSGGVCLDIHNQKRKNVKAPPLVWDKSLEAEAKNYAQNIASTGVWRNDPNNTIQGENLWRSEPNSTLQGENFQTGNQSACMQASLKWYDEVKYYNTTGNHTGIVGHYTQMMWKSTKKLGCGTAEGSNRTIVVCRYEPPGNVNGSKIETS